MKQLDHLSERLSRRTYPGKEVDTKMELVQAARGRIVSKSRLPSVIYMNVCVFVFQLRGSFIIYYIPCFFILR